MGVDETNICLFANYYLAVTRVVSIRGSIFYVCEDEFWRLLGVLMARKQQDWVDVPDGLMYKAKLAGRNRVCHLPMPVADSGAPDESRALVRVSREG